jgi:hypothetical protein
VATDVDDMSGAPANRGVVADGILGRRRFYLLVANGDRGGEFLSTALVSPELIC